MNTLYIVESLGFYKIGVASNMKERLFNMQTGNPSPIEIVETYQFNSYSIVVALEKRFHKTLMGYRVRGEWFKLTEGELKSVRKSLRAAANAENEIGEKNES